ncbi:hypothetical protein FGIG_06377 [Fasciola gigantica]|uniref:CDK5 regulatory subunit-associated protein 3 n=1 Tax=Fasciola gigantica TaxID=46835 RepID=A0A504YQ56_FASGI|nr:hypothetical protein FGIG_06377 [Fasciola gigantica]
MTVSSPVSSPLLIQSSKLIEWLLNRKLLQKNYPKCLATLEDQVNTQIERLPDNVVYPLESPSIFLASVQTYEAIQKVDTQTDFFGRASHSVRSWRDIVDGFKKQNIHIGRWLVIDFAHLCPLTAELSESLQELAAVSVPKCKSIIADEQKHITDLRQKIKEYSLNASKLDDAMEKAFREFSLEINEPRIKLRLLEKAAEVFPRLDEIVSGLNDLRPALELYETMTNYVRHVSRSASKERNSDPVKCCPTLKLLIESGHVRLYTWQTGRSTEQWGPDDDWIPGLLEKEREFQKKINPEALLADAAQSVDTETNEITWDEGDIDFGPIEIETMNGAPVEIDFDVEVVNENGDKTDDPADRLTTNETHSASADIRRVTPELLLDTVQGRNALVNDLVELGAFLSPFCDCPKVKTAAENDNARFCTRPPLSLATDDPADSHSQTPDAVRQETIWVRDNTITMHIDFGPIEIETDDGAPVEIDFDVEVVNENGDKPDDPQTDVQLTETHSASADIPSGKNARLLLDTVQGRNALVNDLVELGAFLSRFCEDLSESQDAAENDIRTASAQGGSIALQQMILQNAPACLQSVSSKDVTALLNRLESIRDGLTNSVLSQLLMIRSKPGFLDRLVTRLQDMRNQEERSKRRVAEAQLQINEAMAEQERQAAILLKHRTDCKRLVTLLEEEISKLCNRPVQVIGQVLNL